MDEEETIGTRLGGFLAHLEQSMIEEGCSTSTLEPIHQMSEIYKNLSEAGLGDFKSDFQAGYRDCREAIVRDLDSDSPELARDFPSIDQS